VTFICVEPTIPLSSPMDSNTSSSLASVSSGTSIGAACCARTAVPGTVLTHPESRTDAAMTSPTAHPRLAALM
jgi:hypothetical protein